MKKQWIKKVIGGILCWVLLLSVCTEVAPIQTLAATKENLYLYMSPNTGKYGFVNDGGLVMIDPVYDQAYDFNNGMALVSKDDKYGYPPENSITSVPFGALNKNFPLVFINPGCPFFTTKAFPSEKT